MVMYNVLLCSNFIEPNELLCIPDVIFRSSKCGDEGCGS